MHCGEGKQSTDALQQRPSVFSYAVLSFIAVVGVFNRITFPAFLLFPGLQLLPCFQRKCVLLKNTCRVQIDTNLFTQANIPRNLRRLRPPLLLNSNLHRHLLLQTHRLPPRDHSQPHNNPPQQPLLQQRPDKPGHPWPPPAPPTLRRKPLPAPRPRLHRHDPLPLQLAHRATLDAQRPRPLRRLRNSPPLHLPPPRTTLPAPLRAPPPQLRARTPLPSLPRSLDPLQRGHGLPNGRVPPRRRGPRPTRHALHRRVQLRRTGSENHPRRIHFLVENLLPALVAAGPGH